CFDIRLIEGVDAENRSGNRRRHLPLEERLAEIAERRERQPHDRLATVFERGERGFIARLWIEAQVDEQPIVSVDLGRAERLAIDRDEATSLLARRFREQLLDPCAEVDERG